MTRPPHCCTTLNFTKTNSFTFISAFCIYSIGLLAILSFHFSSFFIKKYTFPSFFSSPFSSSLLQMAISDIPWQQGAGGIRYFPKYTQLLCFGMLESKDPGPGGGAAGGLGGGELTAPPGGMPGFPFRPLEHKYFWFFFVS
jgi:hypothetical protein